MSSYQEKLSYLLDEAGKLGIDVDQTLFERVTKSLGPALYNEDSSLVSSSDPEELARVRKNFLQGKLGILDEATCNAAIEEVIAQFGNSNRNKHRAIFYYLLVVKFGKAGLYSE